MKNINIFLNLTFIQCDNSGLHAECICRTHIPNARVIAAY